MDERLNELLIILLTAVILGTSVANSKVIGLLEASTIFLIIIGANILVKKTIGYYLEADVKIKFWELQRYGLKKWRKFKKPLPMPWLPLILSFVTKGGFWWLNILEFDVRPRIERVSKRHGFHWQKKRFSSLTEYHLALIAAGGILMNLILAGIGYFLAGDVTHAGLFSKLNIYYAAWSLIPLSRLDGSKVFFGSRLLWFTLTIIVATVLIWGATIF